MKTKVILSLTVTALSLTMFAQEADFIFGAPDSPSSVVAPTTPVETTVPKPPVVDPFATAEEGVTTIETSADTFDAEMADTLKSRKKEPRHPLRKGSYFQFGAGVGVSDLLYTVQGGKQTFFFPSGTVNLGYSYFFLPWMGIGTGAYFSNYGSVATLNGEYVWNGETDSDGDVYNHHVKMNNWTERQITYMVEVPLAFQFQHNFNGRSGIYAAIGAKVGFPIYSDYRVTAGSMTHTGYYPAWDLTLHDTHEFYTEENQGQNGTFVNPHYSYKAFLELGALFQIGKRTDLFVGIYANYGFNNIEPVAEADKTQLGFRNADHQFMQPYNGLIGTDKVSGFNALSGGIKLGLNVYMGRLTPKEKKEQKVKEKIVYVYDTLIVKDTLVLRDTIRITQGKRDSIAKASVVLEQELSTSVIYFAFDKFEPILQPADILDKVAAVLVAHPDFGVTVNGHACKTGSDEYNQRLAMQRAEAVSKLLKAKGVKDSQIQLASFGANRPFRYNELSHQISKDRRVEIVPIGYVPPTPVQSQVEVVSNSQNKDQVVPVAPTNRVFPTVYLEGVGEVPVFLKYTEFIGEEDVKKGVYLAQISRKWYGGEQAFWVYIYEANMFQIEDPNNVEPGITLMIPKLAPELIDPKSKEAIDKANALKEIYLKK